MNQPNQRRIMSQTNQLQHDQPKDRNRDDSMPRYKKNISHIQCYKCEEYDHFANHCPPERKIQPQSQSQSQPQSKYRTKSPEKKQPAMSTFVEYDSDDDTKNSNAYVPARVLTVYKNTLSTNNEFKPIMTTIREKIKAQTSSNKTPNVLQRPKEIQKKKQSQPYNPPTLPPHLIKQIEKYNQQQEYHPQNAQKNEPNNKIEKMNTQETLPSQPKRLNQSNQQAQPRARQPFQKTQRRANQTPNTRISKTDKIQKLITANPPKRSDPIKKILDNLRLTNQRILSNPITLTLDELLDSSNNLVKNMTFSMQRATPRYRIRKSTKPVVPNQTETSEALMITAVATVPPPITTQTYDDDEQNQPIIIVSWIKTFKLLKILLNEKSLIKLIARRVIRRMRPQSQIYNNNHIKVFLIIDKIDVLTEYVKISINVENVETSIKT